MSFRKKTVGLYKENLLPMNPTFRNIILAAGSVLLIMAVWFFREIVVYILVSGVLSIMGRPLVDLLCKIRVWKWHFPRSLSALITLLLIWGLIIGFFYTFIPLLAKQIDQFSAIDSNNLVKFIDVPIQKVEGIIMALNKDFNEEGSIRSYIVAKVAGVLNINVIQNFLGDVAGFLGNMLIAVFSLTFITFFFLKDQHLFFETILMWVPDKYIDNVTRALYSIKSLLTRYFIGIIIQSTCIMILITIGMTIIGIEFQQALVMGLILGVINVIPYVGPWLGLFIAIIMGVAANINQDFNEVVVPLVFYMILVEAIVHTIDNLIFQPVIFSNSVKAHPLEIFVVILASGFAAGIPGMILAIPAYTVLRVLAREFFYNFKAVRRITSSLDKDVPDLIHKPGQDIQNESDGPVAI